jgi:nitrate/TMAO reductase-like tetraheme cytochrome c subunit
LWILFTVIGISLVIVAIGLLTRPVAAAPAPHSAAGPAAADKIPNETCLACHNKEGFNVPMENGEALSLNISPDAFTKSVHGEESVACVDCHTNITGFPHPPKTAKTPREFTLQLYTTCKQCHQEQFDKTLDSVHQKALAAGNTNAAVCTDCHNPHTQARLIDKTTGKITPQMRAQIPQTCARCHSAISDAYKDSVHGAALAADSNPDVPTCVDCHGVHNIPDPTTASFRLKSPTEMCGRCHTNPAIMDKYGISTKVLQTYVSDFHGTTITLFEKQSPDQQTNKPVCFDCHGVHNIARVDDPKRGLEVKANLLATCKKCHPDASSNFPDSWLGHYIPDANKHPVVYYVNLFYNIMIPGVIGGMLIFVISDFVRRMIESRKGTAH